MKSGSDWIPKQEEKLLELMQVWKKGLGDAANQNAFGWVPADCGELTAAIDAFFGGRDAYHAAPTKGNHTEKEEAKKAAVELIRKFAREQIRNNPRMSDGRKQDLGVTVADSEPTPARRPDKAPESRSETSPEAPGLVRIRYNTPKPHGVERIELGYIVLPAGSAAGVDSPDQLPNRESFSHNPWEHTFPHDVRGGKLLYALRYLTKGGAGPWSDVREVIIP